MLVLGGDSAPPPTRSREGRGGDKPATAADLTFIYAPTQSLAGSTQVVARVLEVALHKVHALGFPLDRVVDGLGVAPLAPPSPDFVEAMGRTNDAIIYGGRVHLFVAGPDADARDARRDAAEHSPRATTARPFADIFAQFKGDFYAIDPHLFSPAEVIVTALESGRSYRGGQLARLVDILF